jgi:hypothetical protein
VEEAIATGVEELWDPEIPIGAGHEPSSVVATDVAVSA